MPPPKSKPPIPLEDHSASNEILEIMKNLNVTEEQATLVPCKRCEKEIVIRVPKKFVLEHESEETHITYIHLDPNGVDLHCVLFEVNKDFGVQLPKAGDVIIANEEMLKDMRNLKLRSVYVPCNRCNDNIQVPVPEKLIEETKIYNSPIAYIHRNKENSDPHALILYVDKNLGDRDVRLTDLIIFQEN